MRETVRQRGGSMELSNSARQKDIATYIGALINNHQRLLSAYEETAQADRGSGKTEEIRAVLDAWIDWLKEPGRVQDTGASADGLEKDGADEGIEQSVQERDRTEKEGALEATQPGTEADITETSMTEVRAYLSWLRRTEQARCSAAGDVVVGIGASAGGLEALERFFGGDVSPELTYVVIQHLSPDFKSMMPEILARVTPSPSTPSKAV